MPCAVQRITNKEGLWHVCYTDQNGSDDKMVNGTLAVWSGIIAEAEDDYNAWYEREHMFERVEVPGIRRARHADILHLF